MAVIQLSQLIDISKPNYVLVEAKKLFSAHYENKKSQGILLSKELHLPSLKTSAEHCRANDKAFSIVKKNFLLIQDLFGGRFKGYRKCNTEYHDFRHTLETFLTVARLMDGYNLSQKKFDMQVSINLLLAALYHDTGYIQEEWDTAGTGAKYTQEHVKRSIFFVEKNAQILGLDAEQVDSINSYVRCSHIDDDFENFPFSRDVDRIAGAILGTSDLLGQMADRIYLEKLLFLYYEFREARVPGYKTEFDIIRKTLDFYDLVKQRLKDTFFSVFDFAGVHFKERFKIKQNLYLVAIERNIEYLKKIIADASTNFREKLHRVGFK
jgi:hypothetical protein